MNQTRTTVLTTAILGLFASIFLLMEPMRNEIALFVQDIILRRPIDIALWAARLKVAAFVSTVVFSFITHLTQKQVFPYFSKFPQRRS
jgi:hypothetical protein